MLVQFEEFGRFGSEQTLVYQQLELGPGVFDLTVVFLLIDLPQVVSPGVLPDLDPAAHRLRMDVQQNRIG